MFWVVVWRLPGMMFCGLTRAGGYMRPDRRKKNLAQQTWYAAVGEHSRLFQLIVDVHALTPSWWIERRQRCTTGNGCGGRHTLNCRVCTVYELALVTWHWTHRTTLTKLNNHFSGLHELASGPPKISKNRRNHSICILTGRMCFQMPNQQCRRTEGRFKAMQGNISASIYSVTLHKKSPKQHYS